MKFKLTILLFVGYLWEASGKDPRSETVCPSEPVEAVYSEDAVLPCHLEPPTDATDNRVEWRRGNDVVHLYQGGKEDPAEQRETFEGRTSLFPEGLTKGNLSLKLSSVRLEDSGSYLCSFHTLDQSCLVNLSVGESEVIGSHEPITAVVGQDVVLPCHLEPPFDLTTLTVEWRCQDGRVHVYRDEKDDLKLQKPKFKDRTSLFHHEMVHGNISLRLTNTTTEDSGNYTCLVPKLHSQVKRGKVALNVVKEIKPEDKEDKDGQLGLSVGVLLLLLLLLLLVIVLIWLNKRRNGAQPREEEQDGDGEEDAAAGERIALN